jgi:lipopolysaccharide export system permease protein
MKVLERYILGRTFGMFAFALFWTLAIVWTTQALTRIDIVTDNGQSALTFFEIATLILPSVIPLVLPFALVIAVAQTLSAMNTDSELAVISAAGSPRSVIVRPILVLAAVSSVVCFLVDNGLDPYARQRSREIVASARADLLSLVIQEGTFRKVEDGLFLQIAERLPDGKLGGIFVADSREEGIDLVYYAKTGAVREEDGRNVLVMYDGVVHRKTVGDDISVIRFSSYSFDLTTLSAAASHVTLHPKDQTLQFLLDPDPNDPIFKEKPQTFRAELHRRFTEWTYPFVFALIGLAVAGDARSHREGRIHPLITAVAIALMVRWAGFVAANETQTTPWFAPVVYAVPIASSLVCAWFIATSRTLELPISWADSAFDFFRRIGSRFRLGGHTSPAGTA